MDKEQINKFYKNKNLDFKIVPINYKESISFPFKSRRAEGRYI